MFTGNSLPLDSTCGGRPGDRSRSLTPGAAANMAAVLQEHGFAAQVARTTDEAAHIADELPPDVIVYETDPSDAGGPALARHIREHGGRKRPFLVALGGPDGSDADLHLSRPIEPAVLVGVVKRFRRALAGGPAACV